MGPKDVQLLQGLHSAMKARKVAGALGGVAPEEMDVAQMLSGEHRCLCRGAAGQDRGAGRAALDLNAFGIASLFGGGNVGPFTPKR
ncbi:MAG: hypothetical protein IPG81_06705 [Sandaracinaceae bacterium]|nr:hypothetical protein [Sandaracinaceae bacterium]